VNEETGFDGDDEGSELEDVPPDGPDDGETSLSNESEIMNLEQDSPPRRSRASPPTAPRTERTDAPITTTRSGRTVKMTERARESYAQKGVRFISWAARVLHRTKLPPEDEIYEVFADQEFDIQDKASDPIAFSATSDPDTMYWHQAAQQADSAQFLQAAVKEVKSHVDEGHFVLQPRSSLPKDTRVLGAVWSMKRKRRILTREIYKWKARLNCHGGQQEHGVNFWETYAPVVNWFSIRLFLVISILNGWETRQIDFVLAYPQADVECDLFMEVPVGFNLPGRDKKEYCLKLKKNIYGTRQAGRV
jgi:hypothetical protein